MLARIRPRVLRPEYAIPLRLLEVGLPLTIGLGLVLAAVLFGQLNAAEALVLAHSPVADRRRPRRGEHLSWQIGLYAVLSLTVVRILPVAVAVAVAMVGSGARAPTVGFLGWFGPRGLASIVFAVIVVDEAHLAGTATILTTTYVTIGLSVLLHGLSAAPWLVAWRTVAATDAPNRSVRATWSGWAEPEGRTRPTAPAIRSAAGSIQRKSRKALAAPLRTGAGRLRPSAHPRPNCTSGERQ